MIRKILVFISLCLICSCTTVTTKEEKHIELKCQRVQIALNDDIDYLSYIKDQEIKDDLQYNHIDTSKLGTYQIDYILKSDRSIKKSLIVDVVKMYKSGIYSPLNLQAHIVEDPSDITVLINKVNRIDSSWQPNDLVKVIDSQQKLRKEAADAYKEFYQQAQKRGIKLYSISGYRTNDLQALYWNNQVKHRGEEYASQYSAYPGSSEHQLGLALDVSYKTTGDRLSEDVADSDIGKFIVSDGYKYGFILRYPKDKVKITNYGYEPWHIRYVGKKLAKELHDSHLTLEEYYEEMER